MKNEFNEKISSAMIKYLLGKELRDRIKKTEEAYIRALDIGDEEYLKKHKLASKTETAESLGKECHLSAPTLFSYQCFAEAVEKVREKNDKLIQQILAGDTNMTYRDLMNVLDAL